jgi:hypothetical protein
VKVTLSRVNSLRRTMLFRIDGLPRRGRRERLARGDTDDVANVKANSRLRTRTANTARYDLNRSGAVTAADILTAKGRVGAGI